MPDSAHFCEGHIPVAFVFSVPGAEERRQGRPVAGDTGANLESALSHLHAACPTIFQSVHRYDYRITNAWREPIAVSLGDLASEARKKEILDARNVERVLEDLEGCGLVVLSGRKAQLLSEALRGSGKAVVEVPHVGNRGLKGSYTLGADLRLASAPARREHRVQLWTNDVLSAIPREAGCP
jgi:hypothetical protein